VCLIDIDYFFYIDDREGERERKKDLLIEENNKQCLFSRRSELCIFLLIIFHADKKKRFHVGVENKSMFSFSF
jgi:hypothetical protein